MIAFTPTCTYDQGHHGTVTTMGNEKAEQNIMYTVAEVTMLLTMTNLKFTSSRFNVETVPWPSLAPFTHLQVTGSKKEKHFLISKNKLKNRFTSQPGHLPLLASPTTSLVYL